MESAKLVGEGGGGGWLATAWARWRPRVAFWVAGTEARTSLSIFVFVGITGIALGAAMPTEKAGYPSGWATLSGIIGWTYFMAWSVSFYPQVFLNWRRKSVAGLSFEYQALNLVGFSCYTAYNAGYYWNPTLRAEYAAANGGSLPTVEPNDVFFAIHAVALTMVVLAQIVVYPKGGQRLHPIITASIVCFLVAIVIVAALTATSATPWCTWLNFLLFLSYIKLVITLMKYTPQAYLNWRRKSTHGWTYVVWGWAGPGGGGGGRAGGSGLPPPPPPPPPPPHCSIHNVLLDFTGGTFSVVQLCMDCGITGDWSGAIGDPVKFGLGFTSMVFDIVFMIQHYVLYKDAVDDAAAPAAEKGSYTALVVNDEEAR